MRTWQAFLVALALACAVAGTAGAAQTTRSTTTPVCKKGQVSTHAHPCKVTAGTTPVATIPTTTTAAPTTTAASTPTPTVALGAPQPVADPNPDTGVANPDTADEGVRVCGCDADTVLHYINPMAGDYELLIYNTSGVGYINSVNWLPPQGMTVTAITGQSGGTCTLDSGDISCTANGQGLAPPKCTCETGGVMTVSFTASGDQPTFNGSWWTYYGVVGSYMQITSMTPVPWYIPSFIPSKTNGV
jgi:hypothetical protein